MINATLSRKPPTPKALAAGFGPQGGVAPDLANTFYNALQGETPASSFIAALPAMTNNQLRRDAWDQPCEGSGHEARP